MSGSRYYRAHWAIHVALVTLMTSMLSVHCIPTLTSTRKSHWPGIFSTSQSRDFSPQWPLKTGQILLTNIWRQLPKLNKHSTFIQIFLWYHPRQKCLLTLSFLMNMPWLILSTSVLVLIGKSATWPPEMPTGMKSFLLSYQKYID